MIAASLHQMAEKDDPQVAPEALYLPEAVHADFRQKLFLYREANVLLALMDRVSPSSDVRDPLFEPVLGNMSDDSSRSSTALSNRSSLR